MFALAWESTGSRHIASPKPSTSAMATSSTSPTGTSSTFPQEQASRLRRGPPDCRNAAQGHHRRGQQLRCGIQRDAQPEGLRRCGRHRCREPGPGRRRGHVCAPSCSLRYSPAVEHCGCARPLLGLRHAGPDPGGEPIERYRTWLSECPRKDTGAVPLSARLVRQVFGRVRDGLTNDGVRQARGVTLTREHAGQPSCLHLDAQAVHRP